MESSHAKRSSNSNTPCAGGNVQVRERGHSQPGVSKGVFLGGWGGGTGGVVHMARARCRKRRIKGWALALGEAIVSRGWSSLQMGEKGRQASSTSWECGSWERCSVGGPAEGWALYPVSIVLFLCYKSLDC